jgi:hypothetical protein
MGEMLNLAAPVGTTRKNSTAVVFGKGKNLYSSGVQAGNEGLVTIGVIMPDYVVLRRVLMTLHSSHAGMSIVVSAALH